MKNMQNKYDFLIVGAGLFGSIFAEQMTLAGYRCLIIDQRDHIGGNCYTENKHGIQVHKYGAHIFHTDVQLIWDYITSFGVFNNYINQPIAKLGDEVYNLPFNMNLFSRVFGTIYPQKIKEILNEETKEYINITPKNLEEQAIKLIGKTIYSKFIKGYTEKQWGKRCTELPPETIKRLPIRLVYDNNYFDDKFQGIPKEGYTKIIERIIGSTQVRLNTKFEHGMDYGKTIIHTGMIDQYYNYKYGSLEYRSLRFENKMYDIDNFQGNAVVNYPESHIPYTRSIEHRHFDKNCKSDKTIISYEYSEEYNKDKGLEPYYPIGNKQNIDLYNKYEKLTAIHDESILFMGRLGRYKYNDMDDTVRDALTLSNYLTNHHNVYARRSRKTR